MKIQKELDETKIVLHKTIESVLERGEKIDSLVEKSDGLSSQSKMFYKQVGALYSQDFLFELHTNHCMMGRQSNKTHVAWSCELRAWFW